MLGRVAHAHYGILFGNTLNLIGAQTVPAFNGNSHDLRIKCTNRQAMGFVTHHNGRTKNLIKLRLIVDE